MTLVYDPETKKAVNCIIHDNTLFDILSQDLEHFLLPNEVKYHQGWKMYDQFPDLKEIRVDSEHPVYCACDGALYNRRSRELLYVPRGKTSLCIPRFVERIGHKALSAPNLTEVTLEAGNPFFRVVDGCLYDMDLQNLYFVPRNRDTLHIPKTLKYLVTGVEEGFFREITVDKGNRSFSVRDGALYLRGRLAYVYPLAEQVYISRETDDLDLLKRCRCLKNITVDPENPWYREAGQAILKKRSGKLCYISPVAECVSFPAEAVLAPAGLAACRNLREVSLHRNAKFSARSFRGLGEECQIYVNLDDGRKLELPRQNISALAAAIAFLKGEPLAVKPGAEGFFLDAWQAGLVCDSRDCRSFRISAWQILRALTERKDIPRLEQLLNQPGLLTRKSLKKALSLARTLGHPEAEALLSGYLE